MQFSIEYPSSWTISPDEDVISFEIPNTNDDFDVIVEPILVDHSDYARDSYFMTTDDYTGYRLLYAVDGDQFLKTLTTD